MATWYIAENGGQQGPFSDAEFADMVASGRVSGETLVWNETMSAWTPYRDVLSPAPADEAADEPIPLVAAAQTAELQNPVCAECGGTFPADELVAIGGQWICAGCKPLALQKLREGIPGAHEMRYAGFWVRVGAKIIDTILLFVVNQALSALFGVLFRAIGRGLGGDAADTFALVGIVIAGAIQFSFGIAYTTYFLGKYGQTPGKMACGLRVVRSDGSSLTYLRAFGRYFAEMLSGFTLGIGYIMVAFDVEKRALHDHICDTRVIHIR